MCVHLLFSSSNHVYHMKDVWLLCLLVRFFFFFSHSRMGRLRFGGGRREALSSFMEKHSQYIAIAASQRLAQNEHC